MGEVERISSNCSGNTFHSCSFDESTSTNLELELVDQRQLPVKQFRLQDIRLLSLLPLLGYMLTSTDA